MNVIFEVGKAPSFALLISFIYIDFLKKIFLHIVNLSQHKQQTIFSIYASYGRAFC